MKDPTKSDVGNAAAIVILLNLAFFDNNPFILVGVSFFLVLMAIHHIRTDKENSKFSPIRLGLSVLVMLLSVAIGIYFLVANQPAPLSP